jgi:hypothetical protein
MPFVFILSPVTAMAPVHAVAEKVHGYKKNENDDRKPVFPQPLHRITSLRFQQQAYSQMKVTALLTSAFLTFIFSWQFEYIMNGFQHRTAYVASAIISFSPRKILRCL